MLKDIEKYKIATRGVNNLDLGWIKPAYSTTAKDKTVFRVRPHLTKLDHYDLTPLDKNRDSFIVDTRYIKSKIIPFYPKAIVSCGLAKMFTTSIRSRFSLYESTSDAGFKAIFDGEYEIHKKKYGDKDLYASPTDLSGTSVASAISATNRLNDKQKEGKMNKVSSTVDTVKNANIEAVKVTAKILAGKALNTMVQEKIVPKLPIMIRGYGQTDLGKILLANVAATALTYYAPNDKRARMISEAMLQAAMVDLMANFDVEGMVKEFLSSDEAKRITEDTSAES